MTQLIFQLCHVDANRDANNVLLYGRQIWRRDRALNSRDLLLCKSARRDFLGNEKYEWNCGQVLVDVMYIT